MTESEKWLAGLVPNQSEDDVSEHEFTSFSLCHICLGQFFPVQNASTLRRKRIGLLVRMKAWMCQQGATVKSSIIHAHLINKEIKWFQVSPVPYHLEDFSTLSIDLQPLLASLSSCCPRHVPHSVAPPRWPTDEQEIINRFGYYSLWLVVYKARMDIVLPACCTFQSFATQGTGLNPAQRF